MFNRTYGAFSESLPLEIVYGFCHNFKMDCPNLFKTFDAFGSFLIIDSNIILVNWISEKIRPKYCANIVLSDKMIFHKTNFRIFISYYLSTFICANAYFKSYLELLWKYFLHLGLNFHQYLLDYQQYKSFKLEF